MLHLERCFFAVLNILEAYATILCSDIRNSDKEKIFMRHLIQNGRVIDPASGIDEKLNILIEDGKISCLSREKPDADLITDATGLVVCPGFIDLHAHEDPVKNGIRYADEQKANLACLARMGVTSCLAGNCGDNFCDPSEFLDLIDRDGCCVNVAMLAGYTFFREKLSAAGRYKPVSFSERRSINAEIAKALEAGCAGVSFGLEYVPGMSREELREAAHLCASSGKMIAAHIRACAEKAPEAAAEVLELAKAESIPVQISHIGSMAGYGQMSEFLDLVDSYRSSGVDVCCDCYPYTAFSTTIGSAPYDNLEEIHCSYGDIELCEGKYKGLRCTGQIFEQERKEHPEYLTVGHVMKEEEVRMAFRHPNVAVGSDCFLSEGNGHPRAAGSFPRFLSMYAGNCGLSLPEALFRITALPARRLGLSNKGTLRPGADADIVLLDPNRLKDRATFQEPTLPPDGIQAVFIAGRPAIKDGKIINGTLGKAIRK